MNSDQICLICYNVCFCLLPSIIFIILGIIFGLDNSVDCTSSEITWIRFVLFFEWSYLMLLIIMAVLKTTTSKFCGIIKEETWLKTRTFIAITINMTTILIIVVINALIFIKTSDNCIETIQTLWIILIISFVYMILLCCIFVWGLIYFLCIFKDD